MLAFEVLVNGERLCVAGTERCDVLAIGVDWTRRRPEEINLRVGGLARDDSAEHFRWKMPQLQVSDEITLRIVDVADVDEPDMRYHPSDSAPSVERHLLRALAALEDGEIDRFIKCDRVLRKALRMAGTYTQAAEKALCVSDQEDAETKHFYNILRILIDRGLVEGRGDLRLPAGPRYTECRLTEAGHEQV